MASRYARVIRDGLRRASPLTSTPVASALERVAFTRAPLAREKLLADIAAHHAAILADAQGDASPDARMRTVYKKGMERVLVDCREGGNRETPVDIQAFRLGDLMILGTPFELHRDIKVRLQREAGWDPLLVLSMTNDYAGYAVTRQRYQDAPYGSQMVPFIIGMRPYASALEDEIVAAGLRVLAQLKE